MELKGQPMVKVEIKEHLLCQVTIFITVILIIKEITQMLFLL